MPTSYTAIVLSKNAQKYLQNWAKMYLQSQNESDLDWNLLAHHSIICMGSLDNKYYKHLGDVVELKPTHVGFNQSTLALKVEGNNLREYGIPHIILATNSEDTTNHKKPNHIEKWEPLDCKILNITGVIEEIKIKQNIQYDNKKEDAIIFDLDGTISNLNGRNPFKYHHSGKDLVNQKVVDYLYEKYTLGIKILILSGRGKSSENVTKKWLFNKKIPYHRLWLKNDSDFKKSKYFKEKILIREIFPKYNIIEVLDDYIENLKFFDEYGLNLTFVNSKTGEMEQNFKID